MHTTGEKPIGTESAIPRGVIDVTQLETERLAQERAEAIRLHVGSAAMAFEVEKPETSPSSKYAHLLDALRSESEEDAKNMAFTNVKTDLVERVIKSGGEMQITLQVADNGDIYQFGQDMDTVQKNAYRWAAGSNIMYKRTAAEGRNGQRLKQANQKGYLEDNYFCVLSLCDDTAESDAELRELGFFAETKTASLQFTSRDEQGNLATTSVFVAGVKDGVSQRHDHQAIADAVYMLSGGTISWYGKSSLEILDNPVLIPKEMLPNGAVDFAAIYDSMIPGETFYGKAQPPRDYLEHRRQNYEFIKQYDALSWSIVQRLIAEAPTFADPGEATARLGKLVGEAMARRAVEDLRIDPYVFGAAAAQDIILGRYEMQMGNYAAAQQFANNAAKNEQSVGCPSANKARKDQQDNLTSGANNETDDKEDGGESKAIWKWKTGVCRVESCSTRPGQTKVGPCDICERCQHAFDNGGDPTKYKANLQKDSKAEDPSEIFVQLFHDINVRSVAAAAEAQRIIQEALRQEEQPAKKQLVSSNA